MRFYELNEGDIFRFDDDYEDTVRIVYPIEEKGEIRYGQLMLQNRLDNAIGLTFFVEPETKVILLNYTIKTEPSPFNW